MDENTNKSRAVGEMLIAQSLQRKLPARPDSAHKGDFGKAMIVAGSVNYVGAAALAVQGAMRSGAGLVTLGCPGDLLGMLAAKLTECTFLPLPSDMGVLSMHASDKLGANLEGYTALLVGCGIGTDKETGFFIRALLGRSVARQGSAGRSIGFATRGPDAEQASDETKTGLPPLVLDADALNILADWDQWQSQVPGNSVLTPHPGEMARLTGTTIEEVQDDRVKIARQAAHDWNQVVVLKGANTVIAEPGGNVFISPFARAALATAGSGDVLAGFIAGLIAQGVAPVDAARLGVYVHGQAGEMLHEQYGSAGGLAGDLPVLLALAAKQLREG